MRSVYVIHIRYVDLVHVGDRPRVVDEDVVVVHHCHVLDNRDIDVRHFDGANVIR